MTLGSVIAGLIQAAVLALFLLALKWAKDNRFLVRVVFLISNRFGWRILSTSAFCYGSAAIVSMLPPRFVGNVSIALFGTVAFALLSVYYQWKFAVVGIHGAQISVAHGTNYRGALNLCRNHFSLLGTGAYKLTQEKNFEDTLRRCNHDVTPVRFLLSHPDNKIIADAERKADVMPGTYRENVIRSP